MILNNNRKKEEGEELVKIRVGEIEIPQAKSARLLGMDLDDDQKWQSHFWGKKGLIKALNNISHVTSRNRSRMLNILFKYKDYLNPG